MKFFKLLNIELLKVRRYRAFWFMAGTYSLILVFMIFGIPGLIDYVAEKTGNPTQLRIFKAVVFNFPDIWQNIAFVAGLRYFIKILLGLIVIILVTSEYHFLTTRSMVISGLKKTDLVTAKTGMILFLALFSTLLNFLSGLYLGSVHSPPSSMKYMFSHLEFLAGYFTELSVYLIFCMMIAVLVKKAGIAFIVHFLYLILEPVLDHKLPDSFSPWLPLNAINRIVRTPNTSLIKVDSSEFNFDFQTALEWQGVLICVAYGLIFLGISYLVTAKRDL
ncbi:MAG: hypothetical protein Kow00127_00670 [Bacteroidales bacterium]